MYQTPVKSFLAVKSSLRQKIESKLWTDKKFLVEKQMSKKYQSHIKNPNNKEIFPQEDSKSAFQSNRYKSQASGISLEIQTNKINPYISQQVILEYESMKNQNFYGYQEWIELNKKFFSHVGQDNVKYLWKIMRIINYGDVLIPSGLIFQIVNTLSCKNKIKPPPLKQILNRFLQINNLKDRLNTFRDLKNYPPLEEIQKAYIQQSQIQNNSIVKAKSYSSLKKNDQNQNVFLRNYEDSKKRNDVKKRNIFKNLIQKQTDPQCNFSPQINEYCPKKLFVDYNQRREKECHSNKNWMTEKNQETNFGETNFFKALNFEKSILQNKNLEEIPGVTQYIKRHKDSQAKKRKIQRYLERPTKVFRND